MSTTTLNRYARTLRRGAQAQRGSFLLEALISVLIVALAILGLMGLMARGLQDVDESKMRGEAAFLASSFVGRMWIDDRATASLQGKFGPGGAEYNELQSLLTQRLPNAVLQTVNIVAGATANSTDVEIEIRWAPPGIDPAKMAPGQAFHRYQAFATIGGNN
jgi:Tfp pilus assembly protein PilV